MKPTPADPCDHRTDTRDTVGRGHCLLHAMPSGHSVKQVQTHSTRHPGKACIETQRRMVALSDPFTTLCEHSISISTTDSRSHGRPPLSAAPESRKRSLATAAPVPTYPVPTPPPSTNRTCYRPRHLNQVGVSPRSLPRPLPATGAATSLQIDSPLPSAVAVDL